MKFLHTSDWHLGVKTNGKDRLTEQKKVLDEIKIIADKENVDCIIIAGDIFNTANPSADAEELFFDTIQKLSSGGDRFIFVLAGNHDDPTRLSAGLPLASKHNIALIGSLTALNKNSFNSDSKISVCETGKGYLKIKKGDEVATIAYLPYPNDVRISEKVNGETYEQKVHEWAKIGAKAFSSKTVNIFVSHLFMVGSKIESGLVQIGDIMAVSKNCLPKASYTALGHIHTAQELGNNIFYSGAITKLSINQNELVVNIFESKNNKILSQKQVVLKNVAKYEKITVSSIDDAINRLSKFDENDIVELEIIQNAPLSATSLKQLRKDFACLSNISLVRSGLNAQSVSSSRKLLTDKELFVSFYKSMKGFEPTEELVDLFLQCKGDSYEAN